MASDSDLRKYCHIVSWFENPEGRKIPLNLDSRMRSRFSPLNPSPLASDL